MSLQIIVLDVSAKGLDQWQVSSLKQQVINVIKLYLFLGTLRIPGDQHFGEDAYAEDRKKSNIRSLKVIKNCK